MTDSAPADGVTLADLVDRLAAQFGERVSVPLIVRTVRRCRRELDIVAAPAAPGEGGRQAGHRRSNIVAARSPSGAG
jgi:hypothetical protein